METVQLRNKACIKVGECQVFCGMCELEDDEAREINPSSLFGRCRAEGVCLESCNSCEWLNGSRNNKLDCTRKDHPEHHTISIRWNSKIKEWV